MFAPIFWTPSTQECLSVHRINDRGHGHMTLCQHEGSMMLLSPDSVEAKDIQGWKELEITHFHDNLKYSNCSFLSTAEQYKCKKQLFCPTGSWRPQVWSRTPFDPPACHPPMGTRHQHTQGQPRGFSPRSAQFPRPLQSRHQWTKSQHTGDHVCLCTCQRALMLTLTCETWLLKHIGQEEQTGRRRTAWCTSLPPFSSPLLLLSPFTLPGL